MHVWAADFHSNPTKIFDLSSLVSIEAECKHLFEPCFQTRTFRMGLWCTVGGNDLFSCDFDFPKSSLSLLLHQVVQFNAVQQMRLKKNNMKNVFKKQPALQVLWAAYLRTFFCCFPQHIIYLICEDRSYFLDTNTYERLSFKKSYYKLYSRKFTV